MQAVIIIILILAVLLVIFTLQNSSEITLNVFFWEINNAPLVLVLICCVLGGYILATIYFYPKIWKLKKEIKHLARAKNHPEEEDGLLNRQNIQNPEGIDLEDDTEDSFFND